RVASRGKAHHFEAPRMRPDDIEGLNSHRTGGTENDDATHALSLRGSRLPFSRPADANGQGMQALAVREESAGYGIAVVARMSTTNTSVLPERLCEPPASP